jgi:hypothetical protein
VLKLEFQPTPARVQDGFCAKTGVLSKMAGSTASTHRTAAASQTPEKHQAIVEFVPRILAGKDGVRGYVVRLHLLPAQKRLPRLVRPFLPSDMWARHATSSASSLRAFDLTRSIIALVARPRIDRLLGRSRRLK